MEAIVEVNFKNTKKVNARRIALFRFPFVSLGEGLPGMRLTLNNYSDEDTWMDGVARGRCLPSTDVVP